MDDAIRREAVEAIRSVAVELGVLIREVGGKDLEDFEDWDTEPPAPYDRRAD